MQTSRPFEFPTVHSSFSKHRGSVDHPRFPLNLTLSQTKSSPIWASLPTPPMSGKSPPETPEDRLRFAGHRRKRSQTPPGSTFATTPGLTSFIERTPRSYGFLPSSERHEQSSMQVATQPMPYLPPLTYGAGPALPAPQFGSQDLLLAPQSHVSSRATRKTKAHVASACVNCKKKHLRCDASRPCRRCVQSGKEETCKDVEHKKRGRPPLKPEDPSAIARTRGHIPGITSSYFDRTHPTFAHDLRGFGNTMYPPILPNAQPPIYGHQRTSSRSSLYSGLPSPYAPPSIAHSPLTATGSGFNWSRPQTASSQVSLQATSPFTLQGPIPPQDTFIRQSTMYGSGYGFPVPQPEMPPTIHAPYQQYIAPHREPIQQMGQPESQHGTYGLQLPPIRATANVGFRDMPTLRQDQLHPAPSHPHLASLTSRDDEGQEPEPKRPKMDIQGILGPRHE